MVTARAQRVLLRAEILHADRRVVTYTTEVAARALTVEWPGVPPAAGADLAVLLSFPRLVQPFAVSARVIDIASEEGDRKRATVRCEVVAASDEALALLGELAGPRAERSPESGSSYRCLLVEDNGFIRDLFAYGMEKYGQARGTNVTLALANDAERAWAMLTESHYDMAIVDYYLPAQNGSELIARLRAQPRYADMPVVAISVGGAEAREASMAAGADLFLDKPIVLRDLFATLDRLAVRTEAP